MNPWTLLLRGLGGTLAFFYSVLPNYGIAIMLLTVLVSLLLFPLTLKQTRSMRAMQELQPEIKRLQKEHKADRQELNKQLMALYQERGVNPAAGCLPLIVQMPIWFALFNVLRIQVENGVLGGDAIPSDSALAAALVRGDTSFLTMDLLSSPSTVASSSGFVTLIPYLVLIVIVIVSGYVQQWQTTKRRPDAPQPQQPQGMQAALKILPLFFGFISWGFPTGLVLYFAVSNLFRVGQQAVILGLDGGGSASPSEEGPQTGEDEPGRGGPSPHASKKRKRRRRK